MVNCQEAMGIEAQAPERIVAPVGGASKATIESLRARLLSERAVSKEAQQHAHNIALKVSELQSRLDAEIEHRKMAEAAMKEVLEVLRAKGVAMEEVMTAVSSISGSSESEEVAQLSSSRDGESEQSSGEEASQLHIGNHQGSVVASHMEAMRSQLEARDCAEDSSSDKTQNILDGSSRSDSSEIEKVGVTLDEGSLRNDDSEVEKQGMTENEDVNNHEGVVFTDALEEHPHALQDQVGEESNISQPPEMLGDPARHLEGQVMESKEWKHDVDSANGSPSALAKAAASYQAVEPRKDQVGEESNISQPPEMLGDPARDLEGQVMESKEWRQDVDSANRSPSALAKAAASYQEVESSKAATVSLLGGHRLSAPLSNEALLQHVGDVEKSKGFLLDESAPVTQTTPGPGDKGKGAHGGERLHPVDDKRARGLTPRGMVPPVRGSTLGLGHNHLHPGLFPRGAYPYERPYMNVDPLQHMHYVPSADTPFSKGPMSTAYGAEYGRYPQAPISDTILSLVDDKSGKLGSILMALNLAKQQINDEEYSASYMEEECEAAAPSPFSGKLYPDLYEGVPHQLPYRPWRPEPQNQAPIIHLPMSPTSDYEASAFERHDGVRRSSSTSAYYMPGYDCYLQPKGEVQLGNGITLYTD